LGVAAVVTAGWVAAAAAARVPDVRKLRRFMCDLLLLREWVDG
jgi:hypothetical protein